MTLRLYDTTLRDGTQREGLSLSVEDKVKIARALDRLGVSYIEGGWPGSNPKDADFFRRVREEPLEPCPRWPPSAAPAGPGSGATTTPISAPSSPPETPVVTIVGKSSTLHVDRVLETTRDENLRMIGESVAFLKQTGKEVVYDAEHFFDGYALDPEYALATLAAAASAGADCLVLCDTNGGALPDVVHDRVCLVRDRFRTAVGIHPHNDAGARGGQRPRRRAGGLRAGTGHHQRLRGTLRQPRSRPPHRHAPAQDGSPGARARGPRAAHRGLALRRRGGQPAPRSPRAVRGPERVRAQGRHPRGRHRQGARELPAHRSCRRRQRDARGGQRSLGPPQRPDACRSARPEPRE